MTEGEWMACTDPQTMLEFLRATGRAGWRKLRLFTVACCRMGGSLLAEMPRRTPSDRCPFLLDHERRVVGEAMQCLPAAERYADKVHGRDPVIQAYVEVLHLLSMRRPEQEPWAFLLVAVLRATSTGSCYYGQPWEHDQHDDHQCAVNAADNIARVAAWASEKRDGFERMHRVEAALIRDIFKNPYRSVPRAPAVLTWNDATVVRLAQAAYDERQLPEGTLDNGRLAVLADALEEAGCQDQGYPGPESGDAFFALLAFPS
jgi:hypothetical protein